MANILGALIGAELAEHDGGSALGGAIKGYVAQGAIRIVTPLLLTYAIGWGVQFLARRAVHALTSDDKLKQDTALNG